MRRKRETEDPRAVGSSRAIGSVYFVFGTLAVPRDAVVEGRSVGAVDAASPGSASPDGADAPDAPDAPDAAAPRPAGLPALVVVRVLEELGMSETAARGALNRLRAAGRIEAHRDGRIVRYHLTPGSIALMRQFNERLSLPPRDWDGIFRSLLFTVPERDRAFRDHLRRAAVVTGYGSLRPGLLITPWPDRARHLQRILAAAPSAGQILHADLTVAPEDRLDVAAEAWDLAGLARTYRRRLRWLERATARFEARQPTGRAALRIMASASQDLYSTIAIDPRLPAELLPDDWPTLEVGGALKAFYRTVGPPAEAHLRRIVPDAFAAGDDRG